MFRVRTYVLGFIAWCFYRLMVATWRIELHEPDRLKEHIKNKQHFLLAHFHGDEAPLLYLAGKYKLSTMISTSKDGEIMNVVYSLLGGKASRGSSTRGGVSALKGLIELSKQGKSCNISVDGPKGPIYEIKPGVFELSRILKSEIFTGSAYCESAWQFPKSWNKAYFPKPFARVVIVWTGPYGPITKADDPRSPDLAKTLQNQLFAAKQQAAKLFGVLRA
jgi:lysophospholipid acyltransferase (LPLAT)-like uncharacterized protein